MRTSLPLIAAGVAVAGLVVRRRADRQARRLEAELRAPARAETFGALHLDGLPDVARRYLRHAIAAGTPLAPVCRLDLEGTMTPRPGAAPTALWATETLAPRSGFVWTARARLGGVPVTVRDRYYRDAGEATVTALGIVPLARARGDDVTRSARGRLAAEGVWCPTALAHPSVRWEAAGLDRVRYTLAVDGEPVAVTLHVDADGRLLDVRLQRWGAPDGGAPGLHAYGFRAEAEGTFDGVTLPTRVVGGWRYGTPAFDSAAAAAFTVRRVALGPTVALQAAGGPSADESALATTPHLEDSP